MRHRNRSATPIATRLAFPTALLAVAGVGAFAIAQQGADSPTPEPLSPHVERAIDHAQGMSDAFAHAAEIISPSLVHISVERQFRVSSGQPGRGRSFPPGFPPEFERFFGERSPFNRGPRQRDFSRSGLGSGVIVSSDGHIITNHHVVAVGGPDIQPQYFDQDGNPVESGFDSYDDDNEQLTIEVTMHDGAVRTATLVASDPETDIAVLQLDDHSDATPASFADSSSLRVGEWVVAAGSPFGLGRSITAGIVSATGRSSVGLNSLESYIQTDAAINPGNSGGPLVNLRGEIVGINTAIASRAGGFNGVGFAIPANLVKLTYDDLIEDGVTNRPFLGVSGQELTPELAESFGLDQPRGALVSDVVDASAAEDAGFESGDIILEVDGEPVRDFQDLRFRLAQFAIGDDVDFLVHRDGERIALNAELRERPDRRRLANAAARAFGISVETNPDGPGVIITEVEPGSAGQRLGLTPGAAILEVQGRTIRSEDDWFNATRGLERARSVRLLIVTPQGGKRYVVLRRR